MTDTAYEVLRTAQIQAEQCPDRARKDNALVALKDAEKLYNDEVFNYSISRALDSLCYSVGVFHPEFKKCAKLTGWSGY